MIEQTERQGKLKEKENKKVKNLGRNKQMRRKIKKKGKRDRRHHQSIKKERDGRSRKEEAWIQRSCALLGIFCTQIRTKTTHVAIRTPAH